MGDSMCPHGRDVVLGCDECEAEGPAMNAFDCIEALEEKVKALTEERDRLMEEKTGALLIAVGESDGLKRELREVRAELARLRAESEADLKWHRDVIGGLARALTLVSGREEW